MTEMLPQSVRVKIYDRDYTISTTGDVDRLHRLCKALDRRMREVAQSSGSVDSFKVAVLTALSLAEELDRAHQELRRIDESVSRRSLECVSMLDRFFTPPNEK
jgi:cell division protein ZapA